MKGGVGEAERAREAGPLRREHSCRGSVEGVDAISYTPPHVSPTAAGAPEVRARVRGKSGAR